jgi:hypothetical protein
MRAILIDGEQRSVTEVDFDGTLEGIYKLTDTTVIEAVPFGPKGDHVYVDEEGLFKPFEIRWTVPGIPTLVGKGLVVNQDSFGDEAPAKVDTDWIKDNIQFFNSQTGAITFGAP